MAFSPDGHTLASAGTDRTVRLWNIPRTILTGHTNFLVAVAFSSNGHTLATASADRTVRLWNLTNPSSPILRGTLTGHANALTSVAFSPDGRTLATGGGDQTVTLSVMDVELAIKRICDTTRNILTREKWEQHVSKDLPFSPPCP